MVYTIEWREDSLNSYIFSLVIFLVKVERMALASIYLRSLYARLEECVANVIEPLGHYDVVTHVNSSFLQMFL